MQRSGGDGAAGAVDWAEVRRLYEERKVPLRTIYDTYGLTEHRLRQAYLTGGWRKRRQVARPGPSQGRNSGGNLVRKVLAAYAAQLKAMAARLAGGDAAAPAAWRQLSADLKNLAEIAKSVSAMTGRVDARQRALARIAEAKGQTPAGDGGRNPQDEAEAADVEWMRAELLRRLRILARTRGSGVGAPGQGAGAGGA